MFDAILDNFNRANEGPPPSSSWSGAWTDDMTAGLRVVGNQLKKATTAAFVIGGAYWNVGNIGPDVEVAAKFVADAETSDLIRLGGRLVSIGAGTTNGYMLEINRTAGSHDWKVRSITNGSATDIGAAATQALAANDLMGLRLVGSSIEAWIKPSAGSWTQVLARTDATYSATGKVGACIGDVTDQNVTLDDFAGQNATQLLAPSADSVDGNWTDQAAGTSLAAAIDELPASDSDYIRSELGPSSSSSRVKLATGTDPQSSANHVIHWRAGKDATGGSTINMTVKLYQGGGNSIGGGTLITSFTRNGVDAFTTYDETLSGAEADSITNYGDLYLEFLANQT